MKMKQIRTGNAIIDAQDAQINMEYESDNGFRDAFFKIIGAATMDAVPTNFATNNNTGHHKILKASWLDTKLGSMIAVADETSLYLLEFDGKRGLEREVEKLRIKTKATIILGITDPITSIALELESYFNGKLMQFKTPLHILGSPFQRLVWEELMRIPYGQTRSYMSQAGAIGRCAAYRAVANANGANRLAIVIPCHRIINKSGDLGGYSAGVARKQWLIDHEKSNA